MATEELQPPIPEPDLQSLQRLVGTWKVAGGYSSTMSKVAG